MKIRLSEAIRMLKSEGKLIGIIGNNKLIVTGAFPEGTATALYKIENEKVRLDKTSDFAVHSPQQQVSQEFLEKWHQDYIEEHTLVYGTR